MQGFEVVADGGLGYVAVVEQVAGAASFCWPGGDDGEQSKSDGVC